MNTLYSKLALVLVGLLLTVGLVYQLISRSLTQHYMSGAVQSFNRDLAHHLIADQHLVVNGQIDSDAIEATFERYMTINPSIEIYLLDLQGQILTYSADPGVVKRNSVALPPIEAFLAGEKELPIFGDDPRSHDQRKSFSVAVVPTIEQPEGYLYVVLRGEMYDSIEQIYQASLVVRLSTWVLAASLLIGLLFGLLIFSLLTRRLRRLAQLMDQFKQSDFSSPLGDHQWQRLRFGTNGDEIDQLGGHFYQMAARMQTMISELQERDTLRRELVSHVSHDLRTPLTCLHGYLEILKLKDHQLGPDDKREYLAAAFSHSKQLSRLVSQLFELAKLDAKATKPQTESFVAAELLHDIVQKFQLVASEQGVDLSVEIAVEAPFVEADIGMIERVMENLIANALHHTTAGGNVVVRLEREVDSISIAVVDNGLGIAEQDLPFVFDRFYRANNRSGSGGNHLGLGLAIAKGIMTLHASDLTVSSQLNQGTTFSFQLPIAKPASTLS